MNSETVVSVGGKKLGTHTEAHSDEICGSAFMIHCDPQYKNAKIFTYGSEAEAIAAQAKANGSLTLIGIGHGKFDEHGRNDGECAATLVAKHLGKLDDPRFFRLIEEVRTCDLEAKAERTQIPEILKALYDHHSEEEVIAWGLKAYGILIAACEAGNYKPASTGILEDVCCSLTDKFAKTGNGDAMRRAWTDCQKAVRNGRESLTQLKTVAELIAQSEGPEAAKKWAAMGIEAIFQRQLDFELALDEILKNSYPFRAKAFVGAALTGDNSQLNRAFRSNRVAEKVGRYLDILIVRNTDGHVQVFSNSRSRVPMVLVVQSLRLAEADKRGIKVSPDDLCVDGDCQQIPQWYYFAKGGMAFNGSKSHKNVEVTWLSDREILEAVINAFNPRR